MASVDDMVAEMANKKKEAAKRRFHLMNYGLIGGFIGFVASGFVVMAIAGANNPATLSAKIIGAATWAASIFIARHIGSVAWDAGNRW